MAICAILRLSWALDVTPDKNVVRCLRDAAHLHGRIMICYVGVTGSVNHLGVLVCVGAM